MRLYYIAGKTLNKRALATVFLSIILVVPAFASPLGLQFRISSAQVPTGLTGVIIPLYSDPGSEWTAVANMKEAYPSVPIIAVVNPDNGPGVYQDSNYVSGINLLEAAGVIVLGYVYTSYGYRPIANVETDVNSWKQMYHINGILFDEMSRLTGYEGYYSSLNSYAKSLGYTFTIGNPGGPIPTSYIGTLDNIVIYENLGLPSQSYLSSLGYQKNDFTSVSYGVPTLDQNFVSNAFNYVGYLYITDQSSPNPYTELPSYFGALVSDLAQIDSLVHVVSATVDTVSLSGTSIQGLWTVIQSRGATLETGYSPLSFTAIAGDQYEVTAANYGNYIFNHWSTGSANNTIVIAPSQATTLVAYYSNFKTCMLILGTIMHIKMFCISSNGA